MYFLSVNKNKRPPAPAILSPYYYLLLWSVVSQLPIVTRNFFLGSVILLNQYGIAHHINLSLLLV